MLMKTLHTVCCAWPFNRRRLAGVLEAECPDLRCRSYCGTSSDKTRKVSATPRQSGNIPEENNAARRGSLSSYVP